MIYGSQPINKSKMIHLFFLILFSLDFYELKLHQWRQTWFKNVIYSFLSFLSMILVWVDTTLPPINFHNCNNSLLWRGHSTHRRPHTYPMQWHTHSHCVCNTNFGRTNAQSRFYIHPKTVSALMLFPNKLSLFHTIQYKCQPKIPVLLFLWRNWFAWKNQLCWTKF